MLSADDGQHHRRAGKHGVAARRAALEVVKKVLTTQDARALADLTGVMSVHSVVDWSDLEGSHASQALLVGNGASINVTPSFNCDSLYDEAQRLHYLTSDDQRLFAKLAHTNFEQVLTSLSHAEAVERSLRRPADHLSERRESIRNALMQAIHGVHPFHGEAASALPGIGYERSHE